MKLLPDRMQQYFQRTSRPLFSYLMALPLFVLYEVLILISQPDSEAIVRISVDVWIKQLFSYLGTEVLSISLLVLLIIGIVLLYREKDHLRELKWGYFQLMFIEAIFYAVVLTVIISGLVSVIFQLNLQASLQDLSFIQQFALSLGAGLYEELFFRLVLVSLFSWLFSKIFKEKWASGLVAVVLAAMLFSIAHYTGSLGDAFTFSSFSFRFLYGIALSVIYLLRGFGMAVWTHAVYDVLIISFS
mgnify:CR=1 FL=1